MAFREVAMLEVKEVLRRWVAGEAKKSIARQTGVSRNTVRGYIKAAMKTGLRRRGARALTDERLTAVLLELKEPPQRARGESWALCEHQRDFIEKKLAEGVMLTKVGRLLQRQGTQVPYPTLHRFAVAELGFGHEAPTIPVDDCAPGAEVQLDTGWMLLLEADVFGRRRRFRVWIFTSVYSRYRFVYPCFAETTQSAIEACEAAWLFFGGVFAVVIPDNTKVIVNKADPLRPLINETFLEYAQARGFTVDPARAGHPKDKPRVERAVQTVREDCFRGERLLTLADCARRGEVWCRDEYGTRRHSRTQRLPRETFETDELPRLKPAPAHPYDIPLYSEPKVAPDQHVSVAKALYSLPFEYRRRTLKARADRTTVRLYFNNQLIETHPRQPPGGRSTKPEHFPPEKLAYAQRDTAFLLRQAQTQGRHVGAFAKALLDSPQPWTRMRQCFALLGLCKRFTKERVDETCALALAAQMHDFHRLERMVKLGTPRVEPKSNAPSNVLPIARYLRPSQQYALPLAPVERPPAERKPKENKHD
jgi:transposase